VNGLCQPRGERRDLGAELASIRAGWTLGLSWRIYWATHAEAIMQAITADPEWAVPEVLS